MSTQLLLSNPQWNKNKPEIGDYEESPSKKYELTQKQLSRIAESELRETENGRKECLRQFRTWISQNEDLENCLTDDNFLLRFLRVKKFSLQMAQQTLLKYLNYRKRFQNIMYNLNYCDTMVNELITNGYIFASPVRDDKGRRVIIYQLSKFDTRRYTGTDMGRAHIIAYETLLAENESQIMGVTHVADIKGINAAFLTLFGPTEFGYLIKWGEQSYPMRHKEIHIINMPQTLKYVYDFAKSNMSQKLKERFTVHASPATLQNSVPHRCLPAEMGGDIPTKVMIQMWKEELECKKSKIMRLDQIRLLSDRGIIRSKNTTEDETGVGSVTGSFRRLEVD